MKYNWSLRRFWWSWLKQDYKKLFYKTLYGWNMDAFGGTMIPDTGKGKYVSVYRKGDIIQIIDETGMNDEIRIIPYKPNHGVMVEVLKEGKVIVRTHLDIKQLNFASTSISNIEALASKKEK